MRFPWNKKPRPAPKNDARNAERQAVAHAQADSIGAPQDLTGQQAAVLELLQLFRNKLDAADFKANQVVLAAICREPSLDEPDAEGDRLIVTTGVTDLGAMQVIASLCETLGRMGDDEEVRGVAKAAGAIVKALAEARGVSFARMPERGAASATSPTKH